MVYFDDEEETEEDIGIEEDVGDLEEEFLEEEIE